MKKTILFLFAILITGWYTASANGNNGIDKSIKRSFENDFKNATNVTWQEKNGFEKATFSYNNEIMYAYYELSGRLVSVQRNVTSENLPIALQSKLKKGYNNYWITDLFENDSCDETNYFVTLENSDNILILQSDGSNSWHPYEKFIKTAN
ncbi:MAG TPA: hypothetical protein VKR32_09515 [Puia sp.]|nr:hypothetical protein [Puia sp.]